MLIEVCSLHQTQTHPSRHGQDLIHVVVNNIDQAFVDKSNARREQELRKKQEKPANKSGHGSGKKGSGSRKSRTRKVGKDHETEAVVHSENEVIVGQAPKQKRKERIVTLRGNIFEKAGQGTAAASSAGAVDKAADVTDAPLTPVLSDISPSAGRGSHSRLSEFRGVDEW